ncbi:MAG: flavodoxin domain-containing protein [Clostridia bacterium]|nr:flavodoxin domain-containing protein [Clostridia bacterium]
MKIVYTSNAGSTERYAKMLSEKLECKAQELSKAENDGEEVVYLGWVMAGDVQGLSQAREKFGELKTVVAVGMMPSDKSKEEVKEKNKITEPFFYLPGEFNLKNLKGMYKMMMNMMLKMMKAKVKDSDDPSDQKALELFEKGFDAVKEENLDPIVEAMK